MGQICVTSFMNAPLNDFQSSQHFVRDAVYAFAHALHSLSFNSCSTNQNFLCKKFKKRVYYDLANFMSEVRILYTKNFPSGFQDSRMGLGFMNPTSKLKRTDVTAFCMQLRNSEDR